MLVKALELKSIELVAKARLGRDNMTYIHIAPEGSINQAPKGEWQDSNVPAKVSSNNVISSARFRPK